MKKSILKLGILALLSFNFVSTLPVQAIMQNGVWNNDLKTILTKHIISPVRFDKTIAYMKEQGVDTFVEIACNIAKEKE